MLKKVGDGFTSGAGLLAAPRRVKKVGTPRAVRFLVGLPSGPVWDAFNWFTNQTGELTYVGLAPRGTPAGALAALRVGFERASNDPDFVKESIARNGIPYNHVGVANGQAILRSLAEVSPDLLSTLRSAIGAQH